MTKTELVIATAEFYGHELSKNQVSMYLATLEEFTADQVKTGLAECMKDPRISRFPLPAKVIEKIRPMVDDDTQAREVASRVLQSVSKYGPYQATEARAYMGEVGWQVVLRWGGWMRLNEELGVSIQETTFQAQSRDLAKSMMARSRAGQLDTPPSLPEPVEKRGQGLTSVGEIMSGQKQLRER